MTIQELIDELQRYNKNSRVKIYDDTTDKIFDIKCICPDEDPNINPENNEIMILF